MKNNKQEKTILPEINPALLTFEQWIELEKLRSQNSAAGLSLKLKKNILNIQE